MDRPGYPTGKYQSRHHHLTKALDESRNQFGERPFQQNDFGLAASDAAALDSWMLYRPGLRVDGAACYAASAAMQSHLEPQVVEGLQLHLQGLLESGDLDPELAELAGRVAFMNKLVGYEWCDAYVAVDGTEGKAFYGLLMQSRQRYKPSKEPLEPNSVRRAAHILAPANPSWKLQRTAALLNQPVVLICRDITVASGGRLAQALREGSAAGSTSGGAPEKEEGEEEAVPAGAVAAWTSA